MKRIELSDVEQQELSDMMNAAAIHYSHLAHLAESLPKMQAYFLRQRERMIYYAARFKGVDRGNGVR